MSAPGSAGLFRSDGPEGREPRSPLPWIVAGAVVLAAVVLLLTLGRHREPANPGGAGLAPADGYASSLPITNLQMSQAGSMVGSQSTYVDGQITNKGGKTVTGITVQVAFRDVGNQLVQKETMPLNIIRMRQPYVDTQPVSAAPIRPGETREFRLIFDHIAQDWNQNYPEIRIIEVTPLR
jgi:hypothetical protein